MDRFNPHIPPKSPFYQDGALGALAVSNQADTDPSHMNFNSSRSSAVYGRSESVQPAAILLLPCVRT